MVEAKHGRFLYNKNDLYVGRSLEYYGEWCEAGLDFLLQCIGPGDVVLDVGANIGALTTPFAKRVGESGRVYAFEPQRIVFQYLCANLALNQISNTVCYNKGVGERSGVVHIPPLDPNAEQNFGALNIEEFSEGEVERGSHLGSLVRLGRGRRTAPFWLGRSPRTPARSKRGRKRLDPPHLKGAPAACLPRKHGDRYGIHHGWLGPRNRTEVVTWPKGICRPVGMPAVPRSTACTLASGSITVLSTSSLTNLGIHRRSAEGPTLEQRSRSCPHLALDPIVVLVSQSSVLRSTEMRKQRPRSE